MTVVVFGSSVGFELCSLLFCFLFVCTRRAAISTAVIIRAAVETPIIPPLDSEGRDRADAFVAVGWAIALDAADLTLVDAGGVLLQVGLPSGTRL